MLCAITVFIQPCQDRDAYLALYGGQPVGRCSIEFPQAVPEGLKGFIATPLPPKILLDDKHNTLLGVDYAHNLGITGWGMEASMWDGGKVDEDHPELEGRVSNEDDEVTTESFHATGVAGIIGASGNLPKSKGVAPDVFIHAYDFNGDIASEKDNLFQQAPISADNNSWGLILGWYYNDSRRAWEWWGDELFGAYSSITGEMDSLAFDTALNSPDTYQAPTVIVMANGNDRGEWCGSEGCPHYHCNAYTGCDYSQLYTDDHPPDPNYGSVGSIPCGKNVLSAGAASYNTKDSMASFSGFGPCQSGLIKPDFATPGVGIYTLNTGGSYNSAFSGTSAATPFLTGIVVLLDQRYKDIHNRHLRVDGARAILALTAYDSGNPGPDYAFGYGFPQVDKAMDLLAQTDHYLEGVIGQDETLTYSLRVQDNQPIRCVLSWVDIAAAQLWNDLDLTMEGDGVTYEPYTLDPSNPEEPAVRAPNHQDVAEVVDLPAGTSSVAVHIASSQLFVSEQPFFLACSHPISTEAPCVDMGEPNDTMANATFILNSGTFQSGICSDGDIDWFAFTQHQAGPIEATVDEGLMITLVDAMGVEMASGETLSYPNASKGAYFLRIEPVGAFTGTYSFSLKKQGYRHGLPFH